MKKRGRIKKNKIHYHRVGSSGAGFFMSENTGAGTENLLNIMRDPISFIFGLAEENDSNECHSAESKIDKSKT